MRRRLLALLIACPAAAAAQEPPPPLPPVPPPAEEGGRLEDGLDLLGEGTRLLLEGLMGELGPALGGLKDRLRDLDAYHPPVLLPNGDIIIRRKTPLDRIDPGDGVDL